MEERTDPRLMRGLVEALYTEAMLLADEARSYFERYGREERDALPPLAKVDFSCESLRVTTRLMHVISWLLTQRAVTAGEISALQAASPERRLGGAHESDPAVTHLPATAQRLILATIDLHARVARLDRRLDRVAPPPPSPARHLMARLEAAF